MTRFILFAVGCMLVGNLHAGTIVAKIHFNKRPPSAGLVFINDGGATKSVTVDQKNKRFVQKLYVFPKKHNMHFKNSDDIDHNIFANSHKTGIKFDIGLLPPGQKSTIDNSQWGDKVMLRVGCKIHPKMKTYISTIASSQYQVVEFSKKTKDYQVSLTSLAGKQPFALRMPGYQPIEFNLNPGESKTVDLIKKSKVKGHINVSYQ